MIRELAALAVAAIAKHLAQPKPPALDATDEVLARQASIVTNRAALKGKIEAADEHAIIVLTVWSEALPDVTIVVHPDNGSPAISGLSALTLAVSTLSAAHRMFAREAAENGGNGGGIVQF
jgi:hypothetical protein